MTDADPREQTRTEAGSDKPGLRVSVSGHAGGDAAERLPDEETLPPRARRRLVNLLLGKAAFDLLFACALAAGFHYAAFRPSFRGALDYADARSVRGWVVDKSEPGRRVEVQLYLNGRFAAASTADTPRPDVAAEGFAPDERHGFVFDLEAPPPGRYEARVYAVRESAAGRRRTLQQIGHAAGFVVREVDGAR